MTISTSGFSPPLPDEGRPPELPEDEGRVLEGRVLGLVFVWNGEPAGLFPADPPVKTPPP